MYTSNSEVLSSISLHAGASHLRMQVYVHMGGDCSQKRGIPEKHNKLQSLLDPLRQRGFATRPRSGAERVGALDCGRHCFRREHKLKQLISKISK